MESTVEYPVVDKFPNAPRGQKYNWESLFDGKIHPLKAGEHFSSKIGSMRQAVMKKATAMDLSVTTQIIDDTLYVQAVRKAETKAKADQK